MSNSATQAGSLRGDAPDMAGSLEAASYPGTNNYHNVNGAHTNAGSQSMLANLSIQSSSSSSSACSPTSRSYVSFDPAATRGTSAMPSRLANANYYSGSSSSPLEGESSEEMPTSVSFGLSGGDLLSGSARRGGHAGHGSSLLAHKDSFGGIQGSFPSVASSDLYPADSPTSWRGNDAAAYEDDPRQHSHSRKRWDSGEDSAGGPFGGVETQEDSSRDDFAASPTSPSSEPVEIMGSVSGRSYLARSGSTSNGHRGAGTSNSDSGSGQHPGRSASLSAAAAAAFSSGSTSISGSSGFGVSPDGRSERTPASFGIAEEGAETLSSSNRAISRSQSLAGADMDPAASASRERRDNPSLGLAAIDTASQPANGTNSTGIPPLSPNPPPVDRTTDSQRASAKPDSSFRTAASSGGAAEAPTLRQVRASRQVGAFFIQSASRPNGTSSSRTARPDPSARSGSLGVACDSKLSTSGSGQRSGRDRSDKDRSTAGRQTSSSTQAHHHASSKGEASASASRGAKSSSRTLPQLPSAPDMKPAPPPAMYWSKAPVHGSVPRRSFRAHTGNLCEEVLWLFGGCDNKGCFRDLWCFDTETMSWSKPKVTGEVPPARRAHSATMVNQRLFVFAGGDGPNYFNDLYIFDTVSLRWSKPEISGTPPSPRRAHTCNYQEGQLIVFGGGNGVGALNDVHTLDVHDLTKLEWRKLDCKGKIPIGRGYHTTNLVDGKLIVIGGSDGHMSFNDIHILRLDTRTWYQVKTDEIHNRLGHTATQVGSYLFVFGGHDSKTYTDELLTLNLVNLQWEPRRVCGSKPPGRGYHQAWLRDSRLFVHGGFDGKDIFDDLYYLDLAACAYLPQITSFTVELDDE